jgi:diguanylate cyclase (GGDEF)-like protein
MFWKNYERKFVGANDAFLKYYGLTLNDIIGKTDEDIGWHIKQNDFKENEEAIIKNGKSIINTIGSCIVNGRVRTIVATKIPIKRNNKIVGLIGYFYDVAELNNGMCNVFESAFTDALTHVGNRREFDNNIVKYRDAYNDENIDFALYYLDINKFQKYNEQYGNEFGNKVLQEFANKLSEVAGNIGTVYRIGEDKFAVLEQIKYPTCLKYKIKDKIDEINEIEHIPVHIRFSCGYSAYSDTLDIAKMITQADDYLHKDKLKKDKG